MTEEKKMSKLDAVLKEINKKYGAGSVIGGDLTKEDLEFVSTGSMAFDDALGCGGIPIGKLVEILGNPSGGKSTLSLHTIAEFQKKFPEKKVLLLDYESSFDRMYATTIGVDVDAMLISQPACAEHGYNMIESVIKTGEISLVVIDSHTAALPKAVVDAEVGQATIALSARVNSVALGKIKTLLQRYNTTLIAISQLRTNFGAYITTQESTGGNSYKFYSDIRVKVSRRANKENEEDETTIEVIKNKCAPPFKKASFTVVWGKGIDKTKEVIDYAVIFNIIKRGGSWFTLEGDIKLQGMDSVREFMGDNPEYLDSLEKKVRDELRRAKEVV